MENLISEKQAINNLIQGNFKTILMHRIKFIEKRLYVIQDPFKVYVGLTKVSIAKQFFRPSKKYERFDYNRLKAVVKFYVNAAKGI